MKYLRNAAGEFYEPHENDHDALTRACPVCPAGIGSWCGGVDDVHAERIRHTDYPGAHTIAAAELEARAIAAERDEPDLAADGSPFPTT